MTNELRSVRYGVMLCSTDDDGVQFSLLNLNNFQPVGYIYANMMLNGHVFLSLILQHLIFKTRSNFNPFHNNLIQHKKTQNFYVNF